jgi:hypothetical protein
MDKRNESIYKQIVQLSDKVILYDPTFINNTIVLIQNTATIYQIVKFNNIFY